MFYEFKIIQTFFNNMQDKIKIDERLTTVIFHYNKYTTKKVFKSANLQATNKKLQYIYVFARIQTFFFKT